jgi:hypothetical protein
MRRITALPVGVAALTVVATIVQGADGCGRGCYYNGLRCVPQDEPGYGPQYRGYYGPPQYRGDYGPPQYRGHYGPPGPQVRIGPDRDEPRYSPAESGLQNVEQLPAELHGAGWAV